MNKPKGKSSHDSKHEAMSTSKKAAEKFLKDIKKEQDHCPECKGIQGKSHKKH